MILLYGIAGLLLIVVLVGMAYQMLFTLIDRQRYKTPPGEMIDIGSHRLHIRIMGDAPGLTVVLDAGVGGNNLDWQRVQQEVGKFARVVSYDRGGYGWSEKGPDPRTPERIVEELHLLLNRAGITPPYIMVGHSFGGIYVRLFARKYPDEVAGFIFVESSHPDMLKAVNTEPELKRLRRVMIFKRLGIVRAMLPRLMSHAKVLDRTARKQYLAINMLDTDNVIREAKPMYESGVDLPETIDLPLTVISRERFDELPAEKRWQEYQDRLVALSADAKRIYTSTSSHYTALVEPDPVVSAIRDMVAQTIDNSV